VKYQTEMQPIGEVVVTIIVNGEWVYTWGQGGEIYDKAAER
jgi:hypothetical protein